MKKLLILFALAISTASAWATPLKNLYTVAEVYPAGAGTIYLDHGPNAEKKSKDPDTYYIKDKSEGFAESVFIKETIGENGNPPQYYGRSGYEIDGTGKIGMYEQSIYIKPAEGYEFVCVSTSKEGPYTSDNCLQRHTGTGTNDYKFFWDYEMSGDEWKGNVINVNVPNSEHEVQGTKTFTENPQPTIFNDDSKWSDNVDAHLYVIFRKVGETTPVMTHTPNEVTISSAGIATFAPTKSVEIPDDVEAYVLSEISEGCAKLSKTTGTLRPGEGVILQGEAGTYYFPAVEKSETSRSNLLVGLFDDKKFENEYQKEGDNYKTDEHGNKIEDDNSWGFILAEKSGKVGFYLASKDTTLPAGKAYLPKSVVDNATESSDAPLRLIFGDEDETNSIDGIEDVNEGGGVYNLAGQKVSESYKGIVVKNGKKYLVK